VAPLTIDDHIEAIVNTLGYEPNHVRNITIDPFTLIVEEYLINDRGSKYIQEDGTIATKQTTHHHRAFFRDAAAA